MLLVNAPVVKWISQRSSEPSLQVRVLPGAQDRKIFTAEDFSILVLAGAMSSQQARPRGGVAEIPSDGEGLSVTTR